MLYEGYRPTCEGNEIYSLVALKSMSHEELSTHAVSFLAQKNVEAGILNFELLRVISFRIVRA